MFPASREELKYFCSYTRFFMKSFYLYKAKWPDPVPVCLSILKKWNFVRVLRPFPIDVKVNHCIQNEHEIHCKILNQLNSFHFFSSDCWYKFKKLFVISLTKILAQKSQNVTGENLMLMFKKLFNQLIQNQFKWKVPSWEYTLSNLNVRNLHFHAWFNRLSYAL